jgi:hypothetical protein
MKRTLHIIVFPVHIVVERFHCPQAAVFLKSKKTAKVAVGVCIMLVGSTMAANPVAFLPHAVWDALAYGLHGYGALPVIKILCKKLDLENLEEESEKHENN